MSSETWPQDSATVVVLPAGAWSGDLLSTAEEWTSAWLLGPAFWVLADDLLVAADSAEADAQMESALVNDRPPQLKARLLGRDTEAGPRHVDVELFWALGVREFSLLRLVAVRINQSQEESDRTARAAALAQRFLEAALPRPVVQGVGQQDGTEFLTLNLVAGKTLERGAARKLLEPTWRANIVAAPEDSPTPMSIDSFVRDDQRYLGFVLAHIATAGGLWSGLPKSTYELSEIRRQPGMVRFQRVFARAVATDTLALDLAMAALKRAASGSGFDSLGDQAGRAVVPIASHHVNSRRSALVDSILDGPKSSSEGDVAGFRYFPYPRPKGELDVPRFWHTIILRLKDSLEALAYIPRWLKFVVQRRVLADTGDAADQLLSSAVPKRLLSKFDASGVGKVDTALFPGLRPHPELWSHVRTSVMTAVDSPVLAAPLPASLIAQDGSRLFFGSLDDVLPSPQAQWNGEPWHESTSAHLRTVDWLSVADFADQQADLRERQEQLAPVLVEAAAATQEDSEFLDHQRREEHGLLREVRSAQREYESDLAYSWKMREDHPHGLGEDQAGPRRPDPDVGSPIRPPVEDVDTDAEEYTDIGSVTEMDGRKTRLGEGSATRQISQEAETAEPMVERRRKWGRK